jgi:hypothetical protein
VPDLGPESRRRRGMLHVAVAPGTAARFARELDRMTRVLPTRLS